MLAVDMWAFLAAFIPLFVIVDPILAVPVFHAMAQQHKFSREQRRRMALEASIVALAILLFFALVGEAFLALIGVSMGSFRIAGGLLLLYLSFEMFSGGLPRMRAPDPSVLGAVPFGTPMLAGPGAISTAILLMNTSGIGAFYTLPAILLVCALSFLVLAHSEALHRFLGKNDFVVLTRIMGLVAAAFALEFVRRGLIDWGVLG
ncbi:MAG: MarC family protein [Candidatus Micrarchaeia archaeon]